MARHFFKPYGALLMGCLLAVMVGQAYGAGQKAAVQTTASDWSGAAHAVIEVNPALGERGTQLDLLPTTTTDWIIRSYGQYFYLIGRYYMDSLTKFSIEAPETPIYQESILPEGLASGNPHDMVFLNAGKAYIPMYETDKCWIVNPQNGEKTGEIDLSAYDDGRRHPGNACRCHCGWQAVFTASVVRQEQLLGAPLHFLCRGDRYKPRTRKSIPTETLPRPTEFF